MSIAEDVNFVDVKPIAADAMLNANKLATIATIITNVCKIFVFAFICFCVLNVNNHRITRL